MPGPTDNVRVLQAQIALRRQALAARPPFEQGAVVVPIEDHRLTAAAARPDLAAEFFGMNWSTAFVDLREVLTFQKFVSTVGLNQRVSAALTDSGALFELCLPSVRPTYPTASFKDHDGKTLTISSLNPNLRIAGADLQEIQVSPDPTVPPRPMRAVVMLLSMGAPYLQVAQWCDRYFVRDGHHRAVALLAHDVHVAPCILIRARSWKELVGAAESGALPYDVLFGPRPPRLVDFLDDTVAADLLQPAVRKVIRVRGEEFVVPR